MRQNHETSANAIHWNYIFYFPNPAHLILIALSSTCALKGKKKNKKKKHTTGVSHL